MFQSTYVVKTY